MSRLAARIAALPAEKRALFEERLRARRVGDTNPEGVVPRGNRDEYPLSLAQERIWVDDALSGGTARYNESRVFRIAGPLETEILAQSLAEVVRRHEVLRSRFETRDGIARQVVDPPCGFELPIVDARGLPKDRRDEAVKAICRADATTPLPLSEGHLLRARLVRIADDEHLLVMTVHHIVCDGWSLRVFISEAGALYEALRAGRASPLSGLSIQYADYADWQRRHLDGATLQRQVAFWSRELAGDAPIAQLVADRARPHEPTFAGARRYFEVPAGVMSALKTIARQAGATPSIVVLTALKVLLARYSGQLDVVVGTLHAGRDREELVPLIGFFVNTLVLRTDLSGDPSFFDAVRRVRDVAFRAYGHAELPFGRLVKELHPKRAAQGAPLFQVQFLYDTAAALDLHIAGLTITSFERYNETAKFDLVVDVREQVDGTAEGFLEYSTEVFEQATMDGFAVHLSSLLGAAAQSPDARIFDLTPPTAHDLAALEAWNMTGQAHAPTCMHRLFEAQVERTPESRAVTFEGDSLTYRELDERANRCAHYLRSLGARPETMVGVALDRSFDLIITLLAIHKAGAAYVPLDPSYPAERLVTMQSLAAPTVIVTDQATYDRLPLRARHVVVIERDAADVRTCPPHRLDLSVDPENAAYTIFTSGSTGTPKAVVVPHAALSNHMLWMQRIYSLSGADRFLHKTPLGFDVSAFEIVWPLMSGASLVLAAPGGHRDPAYLVRTIREHGVTAIYFVASMLRAFLDTEGATECSTLRLLFSGGEALSVSTHDEVFRRLPGVELHNLYGPTEATIDATAWVCERDGGRGVVPIGRPIDNTQIHILDAQMRRVPIGAIGHLYIGGAPLARGYFGCPDATAERFVPDPFSRVPGARLYSTGDLARYRVDGSIEFFGRADDQVKIRGNRIELGEIEHALCKHEDVRRAVVIARGEASGEKRLVAYVVSREAGLTSARVRAHLKASLPDVMIPTWIVFLDEIPTAPNGKIDRRALPDPSSIDQETDVDPREASTDLERNLLQIWKDVLGTTRIGVEDNFFEVGGDSIVALQIVSRANRAGVRLALPDVFRHQTVSELARAAASRVPAPLEHEPAPESAPTTPIQRWFFEQSARKDRRYNQALLVTLPSDVNVTHLEGALDAVVRHHDSLRTRFVEGETWSQEWTPASAGIRVFGHVVLGELSPADRAIAFAEHVESAHARISLLDERLVMAHLFDLGPSGMRLHLVAHHLVVDTVSWRILLEDIQTAYGQLESGESVELPPCPSSFGHWAAFLKTFADSASIAAEIPYWAERAPVRSGLPQRHGENTWRDAHAIEVRLDAHETEQLRHELPARLGTTVEEILIAALAHALQRCTGARSVSLMMEAHGREGGEMDLSRTVGWFTSLFPWTCDVGLSGDIRDTVLAVKEQFRAVPRRGLGYGLLRYLANDGPGALSESLSPEISFNYLGQLDSAFDGSMFGPADEGSGDSHAPDTVRPFLLDVDAAVLEEALRVTFTYGRAVYDRETVGALAAEMAAALRALIDRAEGSEDAHPVSPMQHGFLFHTLLEPASGVYTEQLHCRLEGDLDCAAFEQAWRDVMQNHGALRSTFRWSEDRAGPLQIVHADGGLDCVWHDWRSCPREDQERRFTNALQADRQRGFDLARLPLFRLTAFRTGDRSYRLLWSHHHIIMDGWCMPVLVDEALTRYEAAKKGRDVRLPRPRPYSDFIAWLAGQDMQRAETFWRKELSGMEGPSRLRLPRPVVSTRPGKSCSVLSEGETATLLQFARQNKLTLNTIVQAAWGLVVSRHSGDEDVLFGATVSGRGGDLEGIERIIGPCINTIPVRMNVDGRRPVLACLRDLQERQLEARAYDFTPLSDISRWLDLPQGRQLFESVVVLENYPIGDILSEDRGGLTVHDAEAIEQTNYPLTLLVIPGTPLRLELLFDGEAFDELAAGQLLHRMRIVFQELVKNAGGRVRAISLMDNVEERRSLAMGRAPSTSRDAGSDAFSLLHHRFEAQAARDPDATAVVCGDHAITYGELDRRADGVAARLVRLGVRSGTFVGLFLDRSVEMIVAILGILKAGGAYAPLDPRYPVERLSKMLEDSTVTFLLTDSRLAALLPAVKPRVVRLDDDGDCDSNGGAAPATCPTMPADPAYVMYTSGSTGQPKPIVVTHQNIARHFEPAEALYAFGPRDVWTMFHSYSFDFSVWEMWGALSYGSRLVIVPYETARSPEDYYALLAKEGVTIIAQTPTYFAQLRAHVLAQRGASPLALRYVFLGGEALEFASLTPWFERFGDERPAFVNVYGPTEATVAVTHRRITAQCARTVTGSFLGRALGGNILYLLDSRLRPVPVGVCGDIYLGGSGVGDGYFAQPSMTAERFIPNPFSEVPGARMYRTGDRGRWIPEGDLEYLGREDDQVKVRGFRFELGEVEVAIRSHPSVRDAAAIVVGAAGQKRIAAYMAPKEGCEISEGDLRTFLRQRLPDFMIPSVFVAVESLPLSPTGKLDRRALPEPSVHRLGLVRAFHPAETEPQRVLAEIWATVLGLDEVGIDDNFFDLGGDSIRSIRVTALAKQRGIGVSLAELFAHPTIRALASIAERTRSTPEATLAPFSLVSEAQKRQLPDDAEDAYPVTGLQMGMLFHGQEHADEGLYHNVLSIHLEVAFNEAALRAAIGEVIRAHPALRTSFEWADGSNPVQVVQREVHTPLLVEDWRALSESDQATRLAAWLDTARTERFDVRSAPLFRFDAIRRTDPTMQLVLTVHHAILDGWSLATLLTEIFAFYSGEIGLRQKGAATPPTLAGMRELVRLERESIENPNTRDFWRRELAGARAPTLPHEPPARSPTHARVVERLPETLRSSLRHRTREAGVPLKSIFLAAHVAILRLVSGSDDLVTGIVSNGRPESEDGDRVLGLFLNTVPFRIRGRYATWTDLLQKVFEREREILPHRRFPLIDILRSTGLALETSFNYVDFHIYDSIHASPHVRALDVDAVERTSFALDVGVTPSTVEVSTRGLGDGWAKRIADYFLRALNVLAENPDLPFEPEGIMSDEEQATLARAEALRSNGQDHEDVIQAFERRARAAPDALAILSERGSLTYRDLDQLSLTLSAHLRSRGVRPGDVVALISEPSAIAIAGVLGILKTGAAYVPIDPTTPAARVATILDTAQTRFVLAEGQSLVNIPPTVTTLSLDDIGPVTATAPDPIACSPDDLAYVMYTSGSTGAPNGVMVSRGALAAVTSFHVSALGLGPNSRVLQFTSLSFDSSIPEIFAPLSAGGTICPVLRDLRAGAPLVAFLDRLGITHATLPPSVMTSAPPSTLPALAVVGSAGEPCTKDIVAQWGQGRRFLNLYGPTETTVDALFEECHADEETPPLGYPLPTTHVYLLGPDLRRVPPGAVGEICIGGPQLARGYLGQPGLTAERFVPDPWSREPGARMYRTGDLARHDSIGRLTFVGRTDNLVKIRGFRIELGEIESVLSQHPAVLTCTVVVAREAASPRLIAYAVPREPRELDESMLRIFLAGLLPEYMVPANVVRLDKLPLTANGKVDRAALERTVPPAPSLSHVAPRGMESVLAAIWKDVLRVSAVGAHDDFFALGGDSIRAMQVAAHIRSTLGVEISARTIFEDPTVAKLAAKLTAGNERGVRIPRTPHDRPIPMSYAQERLWALHELDLEAATYNVPSAVRLSGPLDPEALERTIGALCQRHDILRTTFDVHEGVPVQRITAESRFPVLRREQATERELSSRLQEEATRPFDLLRGPLVRATLYAIAPEEHVFSLVMHHIVCDGGSTAILVREIAASYAAFASGTESTLPPLSVQYADYAFWQREHVDEKRIDEHLAYFEDTLEGAPRVLDLPTDHPRRPGQPVRAARHVFEIAAPLRRAVEELSRQEATTPFMTLLAAFGALLSRYAGVDDVLIGSPVSGRTHEELEPLVGMFVDTLVLRVTCEGSVRELLTRVKRGVLGAFGHQALPFERLVEALVTDRDLSRPPLVQVMFGMQDAPTALPSPAGLRMDLVDVDFATAKFDLTLTLHEWGDSWRAVLEYREDLFDSATVRQLADHFGHLLERMTEAPDCPVHGLPLLRESEKSRILHHWNATIETYPRDLSICTLFERVVDRDPLRVALAAGGDVVTYGELNARANHLCRRLLAAGVGVGSNVGICIPRSFDLVVAFLATLKAGGCYVPFDPDSPRERFLSQAADARIALWIVDLQSASMLPEGATMLRVSHPIDDTFREPNIGPIPHPEDPAYIVFTSGSTGRPKGVCVPHRAVIRLVLEQKDYALGPDQTFLQLAPASFDAATLETWGALLHGARLAFAPPGRLGVGELGEVLRKEAVTTLWLTAGFFHRVVDDDISILSGIKTLFAGGDVLSPLRVNRVFHELPGCLLVNGYGPTENTTFTTCYPVRDAVDTTVPIGRPIAHGRVYVLDDRLEPVPVGVWGELYAAGDGLAIGYLGDAPLTSERFLPDPFATDLGARMYRTGDFARLTRAGVLEFLGRRDNQLKIRGYRVELGEIEATIQRHPSVRDCVVVARKVEDERLVVAYVVPTDSPLGLDDLRAYVRETLPDFMRPSTFVLLARMPLGEAGKIDRSALPEPTFEAKSTPIEPPRDATEERLARIWSDLLHVETIDIADDFFALGGHSLSAARLVSRVRQDFGVDLPLREVFETCTLERMALRIRSRTSTPRRALVAGNRAEAAPLTFAQERLWTFERCTPGTATYNVPIAARLHGPLRVEALALSLRDIVRRHDVLRVNVRTLAGNPVQLVTRESVDLVLHDLPDPSALDQVSSVWQLAQEEANRPFDLERDALVRIHLWCLSEGDHALLICMHHIVCDGWSVTLLLEELRATYEAVLAGRPSPVGERYVQYLDYARWQRQSDDRESLDPQLTYWRRALRGAPARVDLPTDRPSRGRAISAAATLSKAFPSELSEAVGALARAEGVTPYMVLLTAFQAWLARYTGTDDVVVGSPVANRPTPELEMLIGFFVNTVIIRTDTGGNPRFRELLERVRANTLGAFAHSEVPFERVVSELRPPHTAGTMPYTNVLFGVENAPAVAQKLSKVRFEPVVLAPPTASFDLSVMISDVETGMEATFVYRTDIFDRTTVERMAEHYACFLWGAVQRPEERIQDVPMMDEDEQAAVLAHAVRGHESVG